MISRVTEALSKVKGSIGSNERHALPGVIGDDLLRFGKLPLCLFICIILTAVTVVTTAHHTRLLTAQREQLVLERDALDIEWRNLILEENALGDHSRVERIATEKLQMQHVDPSQENIVVTKIRINATHESSGQKRKNRNARKNRPTSSVGVLRCCAAVFYWRWFFYLDARRGYRLSPRICWCVRAICVRCVFRKSPPHAV